MQKDIKFNLKNLFLKQRQKYVMYHLPSFLAKVRGDINSTITYTITDRNDGAEIYLILEWDYAELCRDYPYIKEEVEFILVTCSLANEQF